MPRKKETDPEKLAIRKRRNRLLDWHRKKLDSFSMLDLLGSDYQCFRNRVSNRVGRNLDFREAIKMADDSELSYLENTRDELRLGI